MNIKTIIVFSIEFIIVLLGIAWLYWIIYKTEKRIVSLEKESKERLTQEDVDNSNYNKM